MKRAELIEKWLEALESGEYKQGTGQLVENYGTKKARYCCLGVACQVAVDNKVRKLNLKEYSDNIKGLLDFSTCKAFGITDSGAFSVPVSHRGRYYDSLVDLNDGGVKFKTIARIIREQIKNKNFRKVG